MKPSLLALAVRAPHTLPRWSLHEWELLVRQARSANLLARLAALLEDAGSMSDIAAAPRAHLVAALIYAAAQREAVWRELRYIGTALSRIQVEAILLKGAAYLVAGLPPTRGRLFSDIDILVPREALSQVEAALMMSGWATTHHHPYDQRYYRRWMHELPPMQHVTRLTVLDVHHAILPPTARLKPDSAKLWAHSTRVPEHPPLRLLAPADMVLHSATHLLLNEEFSNGLRDLVDLDALLRHFDREPGFWASLGERARELDLARPLYYALRYAGQVLGTPMPQSALADAFAARPARPLRGLMDRIFVRALQPPHPSAADRWTAAAELALYLRAHWMRMPPGLLAYHLTAKALRRDEPVPASI